jgi:hypothetical protein
MESALIHKHNNIVKSGIDTYKRGYDEGREDGYKLQRVVKSLSNGLKV